MVTDKTVINCPSLLNLWSTKLSCMISKRFVLLWPIYITVEYMIFAVLNLKFSFSSTAMHINNQSSKEIFMGDIQGSTRMCTVWHYPFVIEPLSHFGQQSVQAILSAISQKLEFTSKRTVHTSSNRRKGGDLFFLAPRCHTRHSDFGIAQAVCI